MSPVAAAPDQRFANQFAFDRGNGVADELANGLGFSCGEFRVTKEHSRHNRSFRTGTIGQPRLPRCTRAEWVLFESPFCSSLWLEHDLFRKPVSTLGSRPRASFSGSCSSDPILTFASHFGSLSCECWNQRITGKYKCWWNFGFDIRFKRLAAGWVANVKSAPRASRSKIKKRLIRLSGKPGRVHGVAPTQAPDQLRNREHRRRCRGRLGKRRGP